jgi:hypothetical protein
MHAPATAGNFTASRVPAPGASAALQLGSCASHGLTLHSLYNRTTGRARLTAGASKWIVDTCSYRRSTPRARAQFYRVYWFESQFNVFFIF